ncbi:MAG TPA: RNA polymerase sigma factor [Planctomycetes bacterium]|nr:RNA polymerase sigma factor [Planctomycetota bacterium]HIN80037.1 RNA polymerase sigma factor [Planctomycetota bacterium]
MIWCGAGPPAKGRSSVNSAGAPLRPDEALVDRAIAGDPEAFDEVVLQLWGLVLHHVRRRVSDAELARDITQDTFFQAWKKRGTLRSSRSLVSWLLSIATRKVIDHYRRRGARPEQLLGEGDPGTTDDEEKNLEKSDQDRSVNDALEKMGESYRTVLILRYWSGLTPAQIARLLAEPEGTIRNRIFRAHLRLRKELEQLGRSDENSGSKGMSH